MKVSLDNLEDISFIVFYGSQTGQAESIAENIAQEASTYDFKAKHFPLNTICDVKDLTALKCPIVIITSTTGDGEPPENADKFWRKIRKKILKPGVLESVNYTLLGLGDTNYNNFCNCGKEIHRRLNELGASLFHPPGWADDAVGLELVVEDWIEDLWSALNKFIRPDTPLKIDIKTMDKGGLTLPPCPPKSLVLEYQTDLPTISVDLEDPLQAYPLLDGLPVKTVISNARRLTKPGALKTALEITLKFQSLKFDFEPGDAIGIVCPNFDDEVEVLLKRLDVPEDMTDKPIVLTKKESVKGKIPAFIPPGSSLRQLFTYYCDIRASPKKAFLRLLADFTTETTEKNKLLELSSRQGSVEFENTIRAAGLSLLDILLTFPSCKPPPEILIEHLPRLIPRAYSISSSSLLNKDSFTFAFNVINISEESGRKYKRFGVCTGWLYKLCRQMIPEVVQELDQQLEAMFQNISLNDTTTTNIVVYKRKNHYFRLPETLNVPIIMVGPGTGIAPFIGFLQHRDIQKKSVETINDMHLYFGCRNKSLDFLYEEELSSLQDTKTLSKFHVSFSRDEDNEGVKYVQHNLEKNKNEVVKALVNDGGFLYVCGDAKNMAKNVRDTITKILQSVKGLSEDDAKTVVTDLVTTKRYLQDVWS